MRVKRISQASAGGQLFVTDFMMATGYSESVPEWINDIRKYLTPDFMFNISSSYKPEWIDNLANYTFHTLQKDDLSVKESVIKLWQHHAPIFAAINPRKWLDIVQMFYNSPERKIGVYLLNESIGLALEKLRDEDQRKYWNFVNSHLKSLTADKLKTITISTWNLMGTLGTDEDINTMLGILSDDLDFIEAIVRITQKKPEIIAKILETYSMNFVVSFMKKIDRKEKINFGKFIDRLTLICTNPMSEDFSNGYSAAHVLYGFPYVTSNATKRIREFALEYIKTNTADSMIKALMIVYLKVSGSDDLTSFANSSSDVDEMRMVSIRMAMDDWPNHKDELLAAAAWHASRTHGLLYKNAIEFFTSVKKEDPDYAFRWMRTLLFPIPLDPVKAHAFLKVCHDLPHEDLEDSRLGFNGKQVFEKLSKVKNYKLHCLLSQFIRDLNIVVNFMDVDIIGDETGLQLDFLDSIDSSLFLEMLKSKIIHPAALRNAIALIGRQKIPSQELLFNLIKLLQYEVAEFGLDFHSAYSAAGIKYNEKEYEHKWIAEDDLHSLYEQIDGDFYKSEFGMLMKTTLDAIVAIFRMYKNRIDRYGKLLTLCSMIINVFPVQCARILDMMGHGARTAHTPNQELVRLLNLAIARVEEHEIPLTAAPSIALLIANSIGIEPHYDKWMNMFIHAAAHDRLFANKFASKLSQPLPPMKTFLAFANVPAHAQWVDICQRIFHPREWVIGPNDRPLIEALPKGDGTEDIHQQALAIIDSMGASRKQKHGPVVARQRESPVFALSEVTVEDIGIKIHATEPATITHIISYLWHSGKELPSEVTPEMIEEVCLAHASNSRLSAGFLLWAKKHGYEINIEKWLEALKATDFDGDSVLVVAAFIGHLPAKSGKPSVDIVSLINDAFSVAGILSEDACDIRKLFMRANGAEWLIARNLLLAAPENNSEMVNAVLANDVSLFKTALAHDPSLQEIIWGASHFLIAPLPNQMIPRETFPSWYDQHLQLMVWDSESEIPLAREIDNETVDLLFAALEKHEVPREFVDLFLNMNLSTQHIERVLKLFSSSVGNIVRVLPGRFDFGQRTEIGSGDSIDSDVSNAFLDKPPSFTRLYLRSSYTALSQRIKRDFELMLTLKMAPVHPALLYTGLANMGAKTWSNIRPYTSLRYGIYSSEIGRALINELATHSSETVKIGRLLLGLSDGALKIAMPWYSGLARDEILRLLVESSISNGSNIPLATATIDMLMRACPIELLLILVCNNEVLSNANFVCAFSMYKCFEKYVSAVGPPEFAQWCKDFHHPRNKIFEDERMRRVFVDMNNPEMIALALHDIGN